MVCGGFTCSKNALCSLNVVYMLVGLLLIGVAAWGKGFGIVSSIHIIGGVIAVGVFLLLISIVGLIGALNHHQVMLFFYMVILFLVFLFQFGVSCSCLAINKGQQVKLLSGTWALMSNDTRLGVESKLNCCGLLNNNQSKEQFNEDVKLCNAPCKHARCFTCGDLMLQHAAEALKILGAVGLFFSFTECIFSRRKGTTPVKPITQLHKILGVWLAARYRNQKDPRANPSAFL
ncbi:tetraspanin-31-like isoform X1 [Salvelinus alpinus]|uniref:tetraspanin-31-like isoform X1 n=1 Tax=Salvelinus alpinus TaxID=8036 RepID=UPI0039FCC9A4